MVRKWIQPPRCPSNLRSENKRIKKTEYSEENKKRRKRYHIKEAVLLYELVCSRYGIVAEASRVGLPTGGFRLVLLEEVPRRYEVSSENVRNVRNVRECRRNLKSKSLSRLIMMLTSTVKGLPEVGCATLVDDEQQR